SGSKDKTVRLWDVSSGAELGRVTTHKGEVTCVAFSHDGKWIASGDVQGFVWLHPVNFAKQKSIEGRRLGKAGGGPLRDVAFSPEDGSLAVVHTRSVHIWNLDSYKESKQFVVAPLSGELRGIVWLADGKRLILTGDGGLLQLRESAGKELASL